MAKRIDMTNWIMKEHGIPDSLLTVKSYQGNSKWLCICECGKSAVIHGSRIRSGGTKSCGCLGTFARQKENQSRGYTIQIGEKFGKLTVIQDLGLRLQNSRNKQWRWSLCQCDCGSKPIEVPNNELLNHHKKSCGCLNSYGEMKIKTLLQNHNIDFQEQYSFNDLLGPNNGKLRFDFAIFSNNRLQYLLEFDGRNHFDIPEGKWGSYYTLQDIQEKDKKKNNYCLIHNIPLKRIPYTDQYDFTYEDIISEKYNINLQSVE